MSDLFRIAAPFSAVELLQEVGVKSEDLQGVYISHMHVSKATVSLFRRYYADTGSYQFDHT